MAPERRYVCKTPGCSGACIFVTVDQNKPKVIERPCIRYTASLSAGAVIPEKRTARFEEMV